MKVSYCWLSQIIDLNNISPDQVADRLTRLGLEVEETTRLDEGFDKVVVGQVAEKKKHPDADRLNLTKIDFGSGSLLDVVCGAQNFEQGDKVVLAQVGASLPNGLKIKKGKIRGAVSEGMLCSEEELGLAEPAEGIMVLPKETAIGTPVAKVLGLDDTVFELGLTPNRGDCLSHWGVARELAAVFNLKLKERELADLSKVGTAEIFTESADPELGYQFFGVQVDGVKVGESPEWMQESLRAIGLRPINNVVDCTNYVMMELGQPLHAYDRLKLEGKSLRITKSQKGEVLPLLDDSEITLTGEELVIADIKKSVALAGVMGGGNSEVEGSTTTLFLEAAEFEPTWIRRAARHFQKHTDSSHRFERKVDPTGTERAIRRLAYLILETAGGKIVGVAAYRAPSRKVFVPAAISVESAFFEEILGMKLSTEAIEGHLKSIGCGVEKNGSTLRVSPPAHRWDLRIPEDLTEEVARLHGYDDLPSKIPALSGTPQLASADSASSHDARVQHAKDVMVEAGFLEALTYSFTSAVTLEAYGLKSAVKVQNPMSEEHEMMVPSVLPGLVEAIRYNQSRHFGSEPLNARMFELRPTFHPGTNERSKVDTGIHEEWKLSFAMTGLRSPLALKPEQKEIDFFDLKGVLGVLELRLGIRGLRYESLDTPARVPKPILTSHLFHPGRTARVVAGRSVLGLVGQLHPGLQKKLKLRQPVMIGELDWHELQATTPFVWDATKYKAWPEFPAIERDFALVVDESVSAAALEAVVMKAGKPLVKKTRVFDVYRGEQVGKNRVSLALRVVFSDPNRSLEEPEVDAATAKIVEQLKSSAGAELR